SLARMALASMPCARRPPIRLAAILPAPIKAMRGVLITGFLNRAEGNLKSGCAVIARTEQCGADAHPGRTLGDSGFQIMAHAHGQGVEVQVQALLQLA